jgi:hypothetical protein
MAISRLNLGTTNQVLVKAAAGQTSNILEAQNSSGTVVAGLTQAGVWSGSAAPGLVLLNTTSFSAVSSFSLPTDTFTSTYDIYRLIVNFVPSANDEIKLRMRLAGTDASGANYDTQWVQGGGASLATARSTGQTSAGITFGGTSSRNLICLEICAPKIATPTVFRAVNQVNDGSDIFWRDYGARHQVATAYDSLTILTGSGTFTGKYSVYGYNQ